MAGPPTKIMIIRHGEKPPKSAGKDGPWDVPADGGPGNGKSLIVPGWQRAGALNAFFAPYKTKPSNPKIAKPDYIYAAAPKKESHRPWETVTPLAAWLGYREGSAQFNVTYDIGGGEPQLAKSVLGLSGVVLICWEHRNIMPNLIKAFHDGVPIANYESITKAWPEVFDLVWVLDLTDGRYVWTSLNQHLMAGDA